jgi:hypothetical protein
MDQNELPLDTHHLVLPSVGGLTPPSDGGNTKAGVRSRQRLSYGATTDGTFGNSWAEVSGGDTARVLPTNPDLDIFVYATVHVTQSPKL